MIKVRKNFNIGGNTEVLIRGIPCKYDNVIKIIRLFDFKMPIIRIYSLDFKSELVKKIRYYSNRFEIENYATTTTLTAIIPIDKLHEVVRIAIKEEAESLLIFNCLQNVVENNNIEEYMCDKNNTFIDIECDKNEIFIHVEKKVYTEKELIGLIKQELGENRNGAR